ncbi:MAG: zinc-ribbon domain-containing protein [Holophagaceae bacterium]|nr:zinc-ribbon domain-containing protein [Holophagaceae bacterium]
MIVVCPSCSARFQYDEARFQGALSKRFRCPKCSHVFEVFNPVRPASDTDSEALFDQVFAEVPVAPGAPVVQRTQAFTPPPVDPFDLPPGLAPNSYQTIPQEEMPPPPPPEVESPSSTAPSTARRDRQSMLEGIHSGVMPKGIKFSLAFLTGPMASTVRVIDRPSLVIGRDQGEIITHDPETSRQHASLSIHGDGTAWLTDLQSTNGTFVEGQTILGTVQLMDRQEFTCGKSTFMLLIRPEDQFSLE